MPPTRFWPQMKFFGSSKKSSSSSPSKKHTPSSSVDERELFSQQTRSEPPSPTKTSSSARSPKKSSRPSSYRDSRDSEKSSSQRHARLARHSTEPPLSTSSSARRSKLDFDTHPLNLPPEERRRLSKLSNSTMSDQMDIDREPVNGASSPAAAQNPSAQTNFSVPITNGTHSQDEAPAPPPHKSSPSSPVPSPQEDAEAYKAAGNRLFKEKNYAKAIEQYTKGTSS